MVKTESRGGTRGAFTAVKSELPAQVEERLAEQSKSPSCLIASREGPSNRA